ncbi:hypothetical protein HanOQP8_Chr06g0229031 [Helianthus annuus]|nr:hypothetical protein HanOQP8_Chr06g0229031 [Helianthus annuus]
MWKQTHLRKGNRPFDKDLDCRSSIVENVDLEDVDLEDNELEGNLQEKKLAWVDDRAQETLEKYEGYLMEKYGEDCIQQSIFDQGLWFRAAGGKKKGKVYGLSNFSDPYVRDREDHEVCLFFLQDSGKPTQFGSDP